MWAALLACMPPLLERDGDGMKELSEQLKEWHDDKNDGNCCARNKEKPTSSETERANVARRTQVKKLAEYLKSHCCSWIVEKNLSVLLQEQEGQQQKEPSEAQKENWDQPRLC